MKNWKAAASGWISLNLNHHQNNLQGAIYTYLQEMSVGIFKGVI